MGCIGSGGDRFHLKHHVEFVHLVRYKLSSKVLTQEKTASSASTTEMESLSFSGIASGSLGAKLIRVNTYLCLSDETGNSGPNKLMTTRVKGSVAMGTGSSRTGCTCPLAEKRWYLSQEWQKILMSVPVLEQKNCSAILSSFFLWKK